MYVLFFFEEKKNEWPIDRLFGAIKHYFMEKKRAYYKAFELLITYEDES